MRGYIRYSHPSYSANFFVFLSSAHFPALVLSSRSCSLAQTTSRCIVEGDMVRRAMAVKSRRERHLRFLYNPNSPSLSDLSLPFPLLFPLFVCDAVLKPIPNPEGVNTLSYIHPSVQVDKARGR